MTHIRYDENYFAIEERQTVLECLLGHGVPIPSSCRSGACQTCLMRALEGNPPASSQAGLKDTLKLQNYFLACICQPSEDLAVGLPDEGQSSSHAVVHRLEMLNHDILRVDLEPLNPITYRAGQFINLVHDNYHLRSYSIASVPGQDEHLQLHVRRLENGRVSTWIHDDLEIGHEVEIRGPAGDCFYTPGKPDQPLLLIGTGSGLAPLYGILRDALHQGHSGPIRLFHGSRERQGLYLVDELRHLESQYDNFSYFPCLSGARVPTGFAAGRVHETALRETPDLKGWRVFLCGHPAMVSTTRTKAYLAGASLKDIMADAFNVSHA